MRITIENDDGSTFVIAGKNSDLLASAIMKLYENHKSQEKELDECLENLLVALRE